MNKIPQENEELQFAFPAALREDALKVASKLPANPYRWHSFAVQFAGENLALPVRIYHNPALSASFWLNGIQKQLLACLMTRHNDGFVRQANLKLILQSKQLWVAPFVVQLCGEYVIEILQDISGHLESFNASLYGEFLRANPELTSRIEQRIFSYWDCYYRSVPKLEYPGFRILDFLRSAKSNA